MKKVLLIVLSAGLLIGMPLVGYANGVQTPQQTPVQQPVAPSDADPSGYGPTSPPSSSSPFFITPNTSCPASLDGITVNPSSPQSYRLAVRCLLILAQGVLPDNIDSMLFDHSLTFGQQIQTILANLDVDSDFFEKLLDIQESFLSLSIAVRSSLPPLGEAEL